MKDEDLKELIARSDNMAFLLGYTWSAVKRICNTPNFVNDRTAINELNDFLIPRLEKLFYPKDRNELD